MIRFARPVLALAAILSLAPALAQAAEITKHAPPALSAHILSTIGCASYESADVQDQSLYCVPRQGVTLSSGFYPSDDGTVSVGLKYQFKDWDPAEMVRVKADLRTLLDFMFPDDAQTVKLYVADFGNPKVAWRDCGAGCNAFVSKSVAPPGFVYAIDLIYK